MHKFVYLNPSSCRPLPQNLVGMACSQCNHLTAKWDIAPFENNNKCFPICSICMMTTTGWSGEYQDSLKALRDEVRSMLGELVSEEELADRVMCAVVLVSRVATYRVDNG